VEFGKTLHRNSARRSGEDSDFSRALSCHDDWASCHEHLACPTMQRSAAQSADIAALQPVRFESKLRILELREQVEIPVEDGVRADGWDS
jgi:hypothetical protein